MPSLLQRPDAEAISASLGVLASARMPAIQHFTLDNGLSVYLCENHSAPLVAVQIWYHIGASHEPPGRSNLSHLLEHLIFRGSSKLPAGLYSRLIARLGGVANATTHSDSTVFEITLPAARLPVALELMADAMNTANFDRTVFELEVRAVESERRLKVGGSSLQRAYEQHQKLAYGDTPYAEPSFGHAIDLADMDLATVHTWYRTWYHPNNASLVVVGAANLQQLRQQVETYFAALPPAPLRDKPSLRHSGELKERDQQLVEPTLPNALFMSFNVPSHATAPSVETMPALRLLAAILGDGFSALLYSHLVRDRLLLRGVSVNYDHQLQGDSLFTLMAFMAPNSAITPQQAAIEIWQLIDGLRSTPLPEHVLQGQKLRLLARELHEGSKLEEKATRIGRAAAAGLDPTALAELPSFLQNLSSTTLQQVATDYLSRERLTTTYLLQGAPA